MIFVTRRETFSASHRLHNENWTDEKNEEVFGKCNNPNGHGHNYVLEVTVMGEIDKETGYVIDTKLLKWIIRKNIIEKVDHKHLNLDVDFFKGIIPTAENIAVAFWEQIFNKIPNGKLFSIKIYETENNYFEYKG